MKRAFLVICTFALAAAPAAAQSTAAAPPAGRLIVTVADQTGAVIPNATVTVTGQEPVTVAAAIAPLMTSATGLATAESLAPGRYTIRAEFDGFEPATLKDYRVRAGDNRTKITLQIKKLDQAVTVGRDKQSASLDPLGNAFSTVLTREQIKMLPDDPDEMEAVLKAMAPPGSDIRVDGFGGGKLPPKSQIRSIRLPRMDALAAQNHGGSMGMMHIDITTQPGLGPLSGSTDFTLRDDQLNARNPFVPKRGDEGMRQFGGSLNGTLVKDKTSFSLFGQGGRQWTSGSLLAAVPSGTLAQTVRQPTDSSNFNGSLTTAVNKDHTARFSFSRSASTSANLGVGGFSLAEHGFSRDSADNTLRMSESGPLGRRFFTESRVQFHWSTNEQRSATEAPSIVVLDSFTSGGAQQAGARRVRDFEAATDLDYVRGRHSMRTGVLLEGGRYRSNQASNYLGTYTFTSMAAYLAGQPASYTRRIGDPNVGYGNLQAGVYGQDDWRLARSVMMSAGLRYEAQTLIPDQKNFSPRVSLTYVPFKNGKTTLRGGWGYFSDWVGTGTYEQTLQVDGFRQREVNVRNPGYPDPGPGGTTSATNRYLLDGSLILPESQTANLGIDRQVTALLRANVTYTYRRGSHLLRARNLNAPVNGVRPDLAFSNVVDVVSDAASRSHAVNVGANLLALNWHRTFLAMNYTLTWSDTNAAGAFSLPANGDDLSTEWGPSAPRHRFAASFNTQPITNLSVAVNARAQSGSPYNITTGLDSNGDGVFNDRQPGVGRNTAVTTGQWDVGTRVSYAIGFGRRPQAAAGAGPGGVLIRLGGEGGMQGGFGGGANDKRYRVEFYASAQNVTNHANYVGFSGVMTSPFFRQATNVLNPRKVEIGMRFGF